MSTTVWIFAEHKKGELLESSLELACEARRLAEQLKGTVCAILFGGEGGHEIMHFSFY